MLAHLAHFVILVILYVGSLGSLGDLFLHVPVQPCPGVTCSNWSSLPPPGPDIWLVRDTNLALIVKPDYSLRFRAILDLFL
jgi:hypothetical protein